MRIAVLVAALMVALVLGASAQLMMTGIGPGGDVTAGGGGGGCAAGQLDFTDACGTTKLMVMLR